MSEIWVAEDDDDVKAMYDEMIAYDVWTSETMESMEAIRRRKLLNPEDPARDINVVADAPEIKEQ